LAKSRFQISRGISNRESIIYNFKVQMLPLNQVTTKYCIWQNYNFYIKGTLLPKGKGKVDLVLNSASRHEDVLGSGDIAPRILDLGTRWR
jgi:hypothetical protein